jgi:hypothetical protein
MNEKTNCRDDFLCKGCGRLEVHAFELQDRKFFQVCPAYGTPFFKSGILYTEEIEEVVKEQPEYVDQIFILAMNRYGVQ